MKFVAASNALTAFNCPHCSVLTTQTHFTASATSARPRVVDGLRQALAGTMPKERVMVFDAKGVTDVFRTSGLHMTQCDDCSEVAVWVQDKLFYPVQGTAVRPSPDLSPEIRDDYNEASAILDLSPRGAAALIRLCIQKLCVQLGQPGNNLNNDIAALVRAGLDERIQKALDAVRVIGNSAVHPGELDMRDDRATAQSLFQLLNFIAEKMISEPKRVDAIYEALPAEKREQIEKRDRPK